MLVDIELPKIKRHKTAKSIIKKFTHEEGPDAAEAEGWAGVTEDGTEFNLLEVVEKQGFWGFADAANNEIHYWAGKNVTYNQIVFFFGHELGHIADDHLKKYRRGSNFNEEARADIFAWVAIESNKIARKVVG